MKRVMIVFEETDNKNFNVFIEGLDKERLNTLPSDQWSAAEFWGLQCFRIVVDAMTMAGAVQDVKDKT